MTMMYCYERDILLKNPHFNQFELIAGGAEEFNSREPIPVGPLRRHIPVQHVGPAAAGQARYLQQETGEF